MKKKKKKRIISPHILVAIIGLLVTLSILSRSLPDGTRRLNVGESGIGEKAIALTFDDGPGGHTEELLDGLADYNAKATFFVIGKNAEKYPIIVRRAYDEGHLIGNHTYDHPRLTLMSPAKAKDNLQKCTDVITSITGTKPYFVRAPYGDITSYQLKYMDAFFVSWSVNGYDWDEESEDEIYNRIMKKARDGAIILLHDTNINTVNAVLRAIPELQAEGYEFVRVDDLLTRNGNKLSMGVPYKWCRYDRRPVAF